MSPSASLRSALSYSGPVSFPRLAHFGRSLKSAAFALLALAGLATPAVAVTESFVGLPAGAGGSTTITFGEFTYYAPANIQTPNTGFGPWIQFNLQNIFGNGTTASWSLKSGSTFAAFKLEGIQLKFFYPGGTRSNTMTVVGKKGGTAVPGATMLLSPAPNESAYQTYSFTSNAAFANIDTVELTGDGGIMSAELKSWSYTGITDNVPPTVSSIARLTPAGANINAASVSYTVTFSESVTGVDATDFTLTTGGSLSGASVTGVTGSGSAYTVTVSTGSGDGTLRLDLKTPGTGIADLASNAIATGFTSGQFYTLDRTAPTVSIGAPSASSTTNADVSFTVTYADTDFSTATLASGDITVNKTGTANSTTLVVTGAGSTRTVTLTGITGDGTLGITVAAGTATDRAGNTASASAASATFGVVNTVPTVSSTLTASATYGATLAGYTITATSVAPSGAATSYNATGLPAGLTVNTVTGAITGTPTTTVGSPFNVTLAAVNAAGTGTATLVLTVNKAPLTVTALPASRLYGAANPSFSATVSGFVLGDTAAVVTGTATLITTAAATTPSGNAAITPAVGTLSAANYTFATFVDGVLAIDKVPLTVTADPATRAFGAGNPAFTVSFTGFVNGENATTAGITGSASFTTTATPLSPVGPYTVTPALGSLNAANYSFNSFAEGTLTVGTTPLTVVGAVAVNKTYNGNFDATLDFSGATLVGVALGDEANVTLDSSAATGAFLTKTAEANKPVTVTGVALSGPSANNYTLTQPTGLTAQIFLRTVAVVGATASSKVYDGNANATFSTAAATLVGIVSGDTATLDRSAATALFTELKSKVGAAVPAVDQPGIDAGDATVGTGKNVVISGLKLAGLDKDNYTVSSPTVKADITPKTLTVAGTTATTKVYDGKTAAALGFTGASLVGIVSPDVVTLVSTAAVGTFANANAAPNKTVTVTGLTLGGAAAPNYTVTQPTTTAGITPANVSISLSGLSKVYDGSPKTATITVTPTVATSVVYANPGGVAPTNAGSYLVSVNVADNNYSGNANATLVIAKAPQTISFPAPAPVPAINAALALAATASSQLPVTFSLVSGPASLSGSAVTPLSTGAITVRATQAGDDNYLPATADLTIAAGGKLPQTIAFGPLANRRAGEAPFVINATASSRLPVTFTVSGPATFNGATRTLTLSGAAGAVSVTAAQAGDAVFAAAPAVTQSFNILATGQQTFFGLTQNNDTVAASISADGKSGTLIAYLGATGEAFIVDFTINPDGTFSATVTALSSVEAELIALAFTGESGPRRAAATTAPRTFSGRVVDGRLSGSIVELGLNFSAAVQPATGSSAAVTGLYKATSTNSASGSTYSIVGTQGQVFAIAVTPTSVAAGTGTVTAANTFAVQATGNATISGAINAESSAVNGTVSVGGQVVQSFAGTSISSARTDRLINLSSRVRISAATGRTLITGFVIGGTESKRVLLRAVGPALTGFGVTEALVNPRLQLFDAAGKVLLENDDWSGADTAAAAAQVGAFGLTAGARDAALLTTLAPGAYTMQVTAGDESGAGLAEIYDASATPGTDSQRLVNISSRGTVDVGADGLLIGGFVVTGNAPKKVLIRGVGPALGAFGVAGTLGDPRVAVYSGATLVAQNDDWSVAAPVNAQQAVATAAEIAVAAQSVGAFALGAGAKDAAVLVTLAPGAYTAQVAGAGASTGVALVEIYEVP